MIQFNPKKLIVLDINESALHDLVVELKTINCDTEIIPVLIDITRYAVVQEIFCKYKPQIVFHAAAYKHVPMLEAYPNEAIWVNIGGTLNVAEVALLNKAERFVLISTDKAVKPSSVMGASKRICELIVHSLFERVGHTTLFTCVRFGNVLGSRGSVVPTFNRQIENGGPVTVTHKDMTRYFMSISEAVNLVIHAAAMTKGDDIFVLKMGEVVKIIDIAERMIRLRGLRPYIDISIEFTGVRPGEKMHEELHTYYEEPLSTDHPKIVQLNAWMMNGYANTFLSRVSTLINTGIPSHQEALQYLLDLCQLGEEEHL